MPKTLRYNNTVPSNIYYSNTKVKKVYYDNTLVWSSSYEKVGSKALTVGAYFPWSNHKGGSSSTYAFICGGYNSTQQTDTMVFDVFNSSLTKISVSKPDIDADAFSGSGCVNIGNYMLVPYNMVCAVYNLSSLTKLVSGSMGYTVDSDIWSGNINNSIAVFKAYGGYAFNYLNTSLTGSNITAASAPFYSANAASITNYVVLGNILFNNSSGYTDTIYSINSSITLSKLSSVFAQKRAKGAAENIGNYALFAGGEWGTTYYNNVDVINTSLTHSNGTSLSTAKYAMASAHTSNYIMFGGGYPKTNLAIDIYDTSLTHSSTIDTTVQYQQMIGASVGDYILFAGGHDGTLLNAVQIYSA